MGVAGYIALIAAVCAALVYQFKFRGLYLLLLISCTQNFIVPLLYTTGSLGAEPCKALIFVKEILLFCIFIYGGWRLLGRSIRVSTALKLLIFFTAWCSLRGLLGVLQGDDIAAAGRMIRSLAAPLQMFVIGLAAVYERPSIMPKFLRCLVPILAGLGIIAIFLFASMGSDFWIDYVNIASYNIELKGESASAQMEEAGVSDSAGGRPEFSFLSELRAMGTFGDPISMAFAMSFGVLLACFYLPKHWSRYLFVLPIATALFLSFTRSAWIFLGVAMGTVLLLRRKYLLMGAVALIIATTLTAVEPLSDFFLTSVDKLSDAASEDQHAAGLRGFYAFAWRDPGNLLGKGSNPSVQTIPESGYAYLLEHYGLPAYGAFLALCLAMFREFSRASPTYRDLAQIGQGVVLGTVVTMHTSFYAFSFIGYLAIWFTLGSLTAYTAVERPRVAPAMLPLPTPSPA